MNDVIGGAAFDIRTKAGRRPFRMMSKPTRRKHSDMTVSLIQWHRL